jgi:condensin complex subunit 1
MAMVEVIGNLIRELALSSSSDPSLPTPTNTTDPKQLTQLYTLLLSRTLDLSSYVRTRTLTVLTKLCDLPTKFPAQRLAMTRAAIGMLEDKAAGVRKGAVGLLGRLVVSHPWGMMHGGLLGLGEWEERYRRVREELEGVEGGVGVGEEGEEDG